MTAEDDAQNLSEELQLQENMAQKIFILKANESSLKGAEQYLRNRGWDVFSSTNLKQAMMYILNNRPTFVLVTADHSNRKVRSLPKILAQALPVYCIGFAEAQATSSLVALEQMGLDYTLMPPVSGPMVERLINKIIRDLQKEDQDRELRLSKGLATAEDEKFIAIKNSSSSEGNVAIQASYEKARTVLQSVFASDLDEGKFTQSGTSNEGTLIRTTGAPAGVVGNVASGATGSLEDSGLIGTTGNKNSVGFKAREGNVDSSGQAQGMQEKRKAWGQLVGNLQAQAKKRALHRAGKANGGSAEIQESDIQEAVDELTSADTPRELEVATPEQLRELKNELALAIKKRQQEGELPQYQEEESPDFPHSLARRLDAIEYGKDHSEERSGPRYTSDEMNEKARSLESGEIRIKGDAQVYGGKVETIIEKGAQKALEDSSLQGLKSAAGAGLVTKNSNLACIVIESTRFSGYLVAALGANRKMDDSFRHAIQGRLLNFLKANGEDVNEHESMDIKLEEVEFQSWAMEQAEFLKKSIVNGDEVAMAFFPATITAPKLTQSKNEKMYQISMADLKEDAPVEFDLYIYLPENDKYLLYTPQGKTFYGNQKQRLVEKGMTNLHIKKESAGGVKKYRAQNYLNEKILEYQKKKQQKASG